MGSDVVRVLLFAVALLLLVLGLAALMVARRPHPAMRRHSVVRLQLAEIRRSARAGQPFALPLGDIDLQVAVTPAGVTTASETPLLMAEADAEVRRETISDVITFAGEVLDHKGTQVRLTITDDWVRGYVLAEDDWWFIEPLRKFRLEAERDEYVVYRTRDLRFRLNFGDDYKPRKVEAGGGGGAQSPPHRVNPSVPVAMVHDEDYNWQAGGRPYDYQRALINEVNGIYVRS